MQEKEDINNGFVHLSIIIKYVKCNSKTLDLHFTFKYQQAYNVTFILKGMYSVMKVTIAL